MKPHSATAAQPDTTPAGKESVMIPREERILAYYETLGRLSRTMVEAAEQSDWESLAATERICRLVIERLEAFEHPEAELCASGRRRRMAILRDVMADDAEIRRYTEPSLDRLDGWILPSRTRGRGG
jgi:flagellar protein FliT